MSDPTSKEIIQRADQAFSSTERVNAEVLWRQNATLMIPNQSAFLLTGSFGLGGTPQFKTTQRIFDATAVQANLDLAAALDSALTNPVITWASAEFSEPALNNDPGPEGSAQWLTKAIDKMFTDFNSSNFNIIKVSAYEMLCSLGTMIISHEQLPFFNSNGEFVGFQFENVSVSDCAWAENNLGIVDQLYRRLQLTAKQAADRFGLDFVSSSIIGDLRTDPQNMHDFVQGVFPRSPSDIDNLSVIPGELGRAFGSMVIERRTNSVVEQTGYNHFPYYVVRFATGPKEQIGRGPGHVAYPSTATLNVSMDFLMQAAELNLLPPIKTSDESVMETDDIGAGARIYMNDINDVDFLMPPVNINLTQFNFEKLELAIKKAFFLDKIQFDSDQNKNEQTAFELGKLIEQMQKAFGPTITRLNREFLDPLFKNSFHMELRAGGFGPLPPLLSEFIQQNGFPALKITYINELARSQRFQKLTNIRQYVGTAQELSQATGSLDPLDRINTDEIMKIAEDVLGVPKSIIRSDKEILQIRDARAKQQKEQQEVDNALKIGDSVSKLSKGQ